ncbi:myosin heavy chain, putative [Eimeria brunetti]|uniref:Myosin heavy chain, putative n=1 Tax=Eimeria brunetti TaxID=51314 RepID=U6LJX2_9EIME|nr:myosin heavy chain, putative [Eimeria brunetti]
MDAENFAKLTAILDLLDRYKKNLAQAVQLENPVQTQQALRSGRTLSKRSTRSEGLFGFGSANDGQKPMDPAAHAQERRRTVNRAQTLLLRRRTRLRKSFPSMSEPASKSVSISCLDEELKDCIVSGGMMRIFQSTQSSNKESSQASDCEAQSDCLDYMAEKSFGPPDVDWEETPWQPSVPSASFENMTSEDYVNLRPQILGQLFDKILDCLQNDFDELVGKLKEQNVHLKQDVISLRKKLQDAVETNDDQVQELKEMTDRISYLETEGRELTRQLSTLETRIKAYQDSQKDLAKLEEEKHTLTRECASLQELIKKLTLQVSAQDAQKLSELAQDLVTLKEKEEEIKSLKQQLSKKEKLLESLNATLSSQNAPSKLESLLRGDTPSRQTTPRGSIGHMFSSASSPRRTSVKHLLTTPQFASGDQGISLAAELQLTKRPSVTRRVVEVQEKLGATLAELDLLRESNESLKSELENMRKEMEDRETAAREKFQEHSLELAATREQLEKKTEALQRTVEALATTEGDLNASTAALYLTTADNEYLQANNERLQKQINEAKQMLREAQERHAEALASRAPPAVVKELEETVAKLVRELQARASELDQAEKRQAELEEQLAEMHRSVEVNMQQIEDLSSQVKRLEGKLAATNKVASALGEASHKLIELVKSGDVGDESSDEAERRRELLDLLEQERRHAETLAESMQQQQSIEVEQREFEATAEALQQQLQEQVVCLQQQLQQQEKDAEAMRQLLHQQVEKTDKAQEGVQAKLRAAYDELQLLQQQLEETAQQKHQLELAASEWDAEKTEMNRQNQETQEALRVQERELQQTQQHVEQLLQQIEMYVSKEAEYKAEGDALRENIGQLELSVRAAKEETERQLAEKAEDMKQLELAQQTAVAVLKQQIEQLEEERAQALERAKQGETAVLGHEYEALKATVNDLKLQNTSLLQQLQQQQQEQQTLVVKQEEQQKWQRKYEALLASLGEAQDRYRHLELLLQQSYRESHRSLQEAQQQLQQLLLRDSPSSREQHFKKHMQQQGCLPLHVEVSELRERHAAAPEPPVEEWKQQEEGLGFDISPVSQQEQAMREAAQQETHKPLQQLLASLREQRQQFEAAADKQKVLIAANERMRRENQYLKAELEELKSLVLTERGEGGVASVLELVQQQLQQLAAAFDAFKKAEAQQLADLKGAVGGPTHVFNVSYPPFVIPMVNVHESRDGNDKTINISGMLDVRAAATGAVASPSLGAPWGPRSRLATLQGSRFREFLSRWCDGGCCSSSSSSNSIEGGPGGASCCLGRDCGAEGQGDHWHTNTQAFKPTGKEEVQALRLCVGPSGRGPRLEGPFQLSEMAAATQQETNNSSSSNCNSSSSSGNIAPAAAY